MSHSEECEKYFKQYRQEISDPSFSRTEPFSPEWSCWTYSAREKRVDQKAQELLMEQDALCARLLSIRQQLGSLEAWGQQVLDRSPVGFARYKVKPRYRLEDFTVVGKASVEMRRKEERDSLWEAQTDNQHNLRILSFISVEPKNQED